MLPSLDQLRLLMPRLHVSTWTRCVEGEIRTLPAATVCCPKGAALQRYEPSQEEIASRESSWLTHHVVSQARQLMHRAELLLAGVAQGLGVEEEPRRSPLFSRCLEIADRVYDPVLVGAHWVLLRRLLFGAFLYGCGGYGLYRASEWMEAALGLSLGMALIFWALPFLGVAIWSYDAQFGRFERWICDLSCTISERRAGDTDKPRQFREPRSGEHPALPLDVVVRLDWLEATESSDRPWPVAHIHVVDRFDRSWAAFSTPCDPLDTPELFSAGFSAGQLARSYVDRAMAEHSAVTQLLQDAAQNSALIPV